MSYQPHPLTREEKARWLTALRSGKYKQGTNYLWSRSGRSREHCCLGVLADLLDPTGWDDHATTPNWWESCEVLPETILPGAAQSLLAEDNDNGVPFEDIADWIDINILPEGEL